VTTRVIGIGQPAAGDDAVGHAIIEAMGELALPPGVELVRVREASALLPLLEDVSQVVVVDAVIGAGAPGTVRVLDESELDGAGMSSVSSHGIGVVQAIELARTLSPHAPEVRLVAVSIAAPSEYREGLSEEVSCAVAEAARLVASLVAERVDGVRDSP
jgi:hydrogenase maturation protease